MYRTVIVIKLHIIQLNIDTHVFKNIDHMKLNFVHTFLLNVKHKLD